MAENVLTPIVKFPLSKEELEEKITRDICYDFREVRSWVMRRTWAIFEEERVPFREAVRRGWSDVKEACRKKGAFI